MFRGIKKLVVGVAVSIVAGYATYYFVKRSNFNPNSRYTLGQVLDSMNGITVHYNGMVGHTDGRNLAPDGYNIGMRYQCVEFVKRYYYQKLHHKMPDAYGNAKDFFDHSLTDSAYNTQRGLMQFTNNSVTRPREEDLLIFDGHAGNKYGHVAIVAWVSDTVLSIIQQNPGPFASSRDTFEIAYTGGKWRIDHPRVLGWLRKDTAMAAAQP